MGPVAAKEMHELILLLEELQWARSTACCRTNSQLRPKQLRLALANHGGLLGSRLLRPAC